MPPKKIDSGESDREDHILWNEMYNSWQNGDFGSLSEERLKEIMDPMLGMSSEGVAELFPEAKELFGSRNPLKNLKMLSIIKSKLHEMLVEAGSEEGEEMESRVTEVLSPDEKFLWTGEEWIPAPPGQTQSSGQTVFSGDGSSPNTDELLDRIRSNFKAHESPRPESYNLYSSEEEYSAQQSGEALGLATTVAGWNGVVLLALIFTAYSFMEKSQYGPVPGDSWIFIAFKALVVAWVIGITLSVYSRVKSARVQDMETQEQIRILNKTSTVLLTLPLLPIALIIFMLYLSMKYGDTGARSR